MGLPITVHVFAYVVKDENNQDVLKTTVSPEVLNLPQTVANGIVTINFQIESSGYKFQSPTGIEWQSPDLDHQFGAVQYSVPDRRSATVENRNSDGRAFAYRVYVTDDAGQLMASVDPVVQNDTR